LNVKLKNITFKPNEKVVIKNADINIQFGITTFLGQNGSGKTTLMKLISKIIEPSSGEIYIDSKNIKNINRNELSKKIAYVSQDRENLQGFTIYEYVEMGRFPYQNFLGINDSDSKRIIENSLKTVNLINRKTELVNNLSGGEMQILRIARALVQDVDLILFDEPTSNLDIKNTIVVKDLIFNLNKSGKKIIISTHDINFAKILSDYIFMIKSGEIIYEGIVKNVLTKKNIIDCYELNNFDDFGITAS
tara:strand:+ start:563 stop:1306 length:744 start_codon:yes stop_codon:yes gene_type:complete